MLSLSALPQKLNLFLLLEVRRRSESGLPRSFVYVVECGPAQTVQGKATLDLACIWESLSCFSEVLRVMHRASLGQDAVFIEKWGIITPRRFQGQTDVETTVCSFRTGELTRSGVFFVIRGTVSSHHSLANFGNSRLPEKIETNMEDFLFHGNSEGSLNSCRVSMLIWEPNR